MREGVTMMSTSILTTSHYGVVRFGDLAVEAVVLVKLDVVTAVPWTANVLAVTVPLMAGIEPIVTLFPTVTDEIETGTVPLMLAVTLPICAVPAERAGSELTVTVVDASVTPCVGTVANETG